MSAICLNRRTLLASAAAALATPATMTTAKTVKSFFIVLSLLPV